MDAREWRKLYQIFWVEQKKFYASFDTAIGILQSMLIYPSKARNDIDIAICQRPAEIPQAEWTPDKQFQAAMTKLRTSYAPRNETDTTTLRRQLQELSDEIDGGISFPLHCQTLLGIFFRRGDCWGGTKFQSQS